MNLKKTTLICLLMLFILSCTAYADTFITYNAPEIKLNFKEDSIKLTLPEKDSKVFSVVYCNGRLFMPFDEAVEYFGYESREYRGGYVLSKGDVKTYVKNPTVQSNRVKLATYNNKLFVNLYELLEPFSLVPIYDIKLKSINILNNVNTNTAQELAVSSGANKAYIRIEDIMADGLDTSVEPRFTVEGIEKLRYTAQYLYERGAEYYIAFIPVYVNGASGYKNDVSQEYNIYNSYFIYVLDYMTEHGGHIGAHGYTHQYGKDISAVGYEWGENTPYNYTEQQQRFIWARQCLERLGYEAEFFEFPHYGATQKQIEMASQYYDVLYHPFPDTKLYNTFTFTNRTGKKVYFMPTPADYVHSKSDRKGIIARIDESISNKYTLSLFYHPAIDEDLIYVHTENNDRKWNYSHKGILPDIFSHVSGLGYKFSKII